MKTAHSMYHTRVYMDPSRRDDRGQRLKQKAKYEESENGTTSNL